MYRRCLVILTQFTQTAGHQHPKLEMVLSNYARALQALGRTEAEIDAALKSVFEEARDTEGQATSSASAHAA
jgi:ABC-type transporter Mla subunit MlaD